MCSEYQGWSVHRNSDQPTHIKLQPSPAQWLSQTQWAGLGQDDFVGAISLAILTCQGDISQLYDNEMPLRSLETPVYINKFNYMMEIH